MGITHVRSILTAMRDRDRTTALAHDETTLRRLGAGSLCPSQGHSQVRQHALSRSPSMPSLAMIRTTTSPACNGMTTTRTAATRLCGTACRSVLVPSIDDPYQVNGHHRTIGPCAKTYIQA